MALNVIQVLLENPQGTFQNHVSVLKDQKIVIKNILPENT